MDQIRRFRESAQPAEAPDKPYIAILPGSRRNEISYCLPTMIAAAKRFPDFAIRVAAAPGIDDSFYARWLPADVPLTRDTYTLVTHARAAIVNSGTATLETALLGCPQVAVYHVGCPRLFGLFWRMFFKMRLFTLPNIILGREAIREKLALHFTVDEVAEELDHLLYDETCRQRMLADYAEIARLLGDTPAPVNAAKIIVQINK
jgi:lipid-A-disaccharide synthase